jgi:hypothetical protein
MSFNSNLLSIENFIESFDTSADALASRINLSVYFNDVNVTNFRSFPSSAWECCFVSWIFVSSQYGDWELAQSISAELFTNLS